MARFRITAAQLVTILGVGLAPISPAFAQDAAPSAEEAPLEESGVEEGAADAEKPADEERAAEDEAGEEAEEKESESEEEEDAAADERATDESPALPDAKRMDRPVEVLRTPPPAQTDEQIEQAEVQETPEPEEASEAALREEEEKSALKELPPTDAEDFEAGAEEELWEISFDGYIRAQYTAIENDPNYELVGRRDGFSLGNIRTRARGSFADTVGFNVAVEGAATLPKGSGDEAAGELSARLKDAFIYYAPHDLARLSAGQFKAPFDAEGLQLTSKLLFVDRSIGNRGVSGVEGLPTPGLSQGRQVGLRLDSKPFYFQPGEADAEDGFGVSYSLALTNGQKDNLKYNDNEKLAYFGRVNLHWGDMIQVGGAGFHNERLLGVEPDQISEKRTGWTADIQGEAYGVSLLANIVQTDITPAPELTAEQARTARSIQAQIAYEEPFFGFQPAYRIALYDPNVEDDSNSPAFDQLTYHTIGLNYNSKLYPARVMLNYTITGEEHVELDNNRLDAMVQLVW